MINHKGRLMQESSNLEIVEMKDPFDPSSTIDAVISSMILGPKNPPKRGKVKDVYDLGNHLIIYYTDRISAFDVVFKDPVPHKGIYLCKLSTFWFKESSHIFPNHLVEELDMRSMKVVKAKRIDLEWIVRGYLYGSAWRAYAKGVRTISGVKIPSGLQMAEKLPEPILTPTTKSEVGHDVEISKEEALAKGLVSRSEWNELEEASFKLYEFYSKRAKDVGVILADIKLEFGRYKGDLIQIDEPPTHDTARIWSLKHYELGKPQESYCLDKEFFRAFLKKIGYVGEGEPPRLPWPLIEQVALRVKGAYEVLTGKISVQDLRLKSVDEVLAKVQGDVNG